MGDKTKRSILTLRFSFSQLFVFTIIDNYKNKITTNNFSVKTYQHRMLISCLYYVNMYILNGYMQL